MKYTLFYLFLTAIISTSYGQTNRLQHIKLIEKQLETATDDTVKVRLYCDLAVKYRSFDPEMAEKQSLLAFESAEKSKDKYSISKAIISLGTNHFYSGEYEMGLVYADKALEILDADTINIQNNSERINNQLAKIYAAFGTGYDFKGDYASSISYYLKSTSIFEHTKSSDGYADQFGGEKGKKFKYSNFKKILLETNNVPAEEQRLKLLEVFTNWQGSLEQLDDVCVIGIRI